MCAESLQIEFGAIMNELDIKKYINLSDFLGTVLGPDYEIIVYDLKQILYIINGNISGRKRGRPAKSNYEKHFTKRRVRQGNMAIKL